MVNQLDGRPSAHGAAPLKLRRMSVPKASDVLADELRRQIIEGGMPEGSALPVERELAESVGMSRSSVREALRVLEIEGLVETRPGRAGGTFVRRPDATIVERNLDLFVGGQGVRFEALVEAREALEPVVAGLAAIHRTDADLSMLEGLSTRMEEAVDDVAVFLKLNVEWHIAVALASHNEIVTVFMNSLSRAILAGTDLAEINTHDTMLETVAAHDRVLTAIRSGDRGAATTAMGKHVHAYKKLLEGLEGNEIPDQLHLAD